MKQALARLSSKASLIWCKVMHPAPMWPVKGHYICPTCQRSYPVPWEEPITKAPSPEENGKVVNISVAQGRAA